MSFNDSIWSSSARENDRKPIGSQPYGKMYGFNYLPDNFPAPEAEKLADENTDFLTKVAAETSPARAFEVWLGAVDGRQRFGNNEAAKKAGGIGQPDFDYVTHGVDHGTKEQSEDIGNFNYGATGYVLFMNILTNAGLGEGIADAVARPILRLGGGAYQVYQDVKLGRFFAVDHNAWGEEVKDVSRVEAGMDYGQFIRLRELAGKSGVHFDAKDFGFSKAQSFPFHLTKMDLEEELHIKALKTEVEDTLKRWRQESDLQGGE